MASPSVQMGGITHLPFWMRARGALVGRDAHPNVIRVGAEGRVVLEHPFTPR